MSRATGRQPPTVPGVPAPMPGVFNQNITNQQLGAGWNQALNFWTTPWGFVKGAAAAVADASFSHKSQGGQSVLSYSPPALKSPSGQPYCGRIHQQPEPGDESGDARRKRGGRRSAPRVRYRTIRT